MSLVTIGMGVMALLLAVDLLTAPTYEPKS